MPYSVLPTGIPLQNGMKPIKPLFSTLSVYIFFVVVCSEICDKEDRHVQVSDEGLRSPNLSALGHSFHHTLGSELGVCGVRVGGKY